MVKLALLDGLPITSMRSCLSSPFAILGSSATIAASALVVFLRFFAASATMEEGGGQETQTPTPPSPYNALRSLDPEIWRSLLLWLDEENVSWEYETDCGCWRAMAPQLISLLESAWKNGNASAAGVPSDHPHDEYHWDLVDMKQTRFRGARACREVNVRKIRRVRVSKFRRRSE